MQSNTPSTSVNRDALSSEIRKKSIEAKVLQMVKEREQRLAYNDQFRSNSNLKSNLPMQRSLSKNFSA